MSNREHITCIQISKATKSRLDDIGKKTRNLRRHHQTASSATTMKPSLSFPDVVDEDDDCIICRKLLLKHSESEADQCFRKLFELKEVKVKF